MDNLEHAEYNAALCCGVTFLLFLWLVQIYETDPEPPMRWFCAS